MADYQDLIGATFGKCRVVAFDRLVCYKYKSGVNNRIYYKCVCLQCNSEFSRVRPHIKRGSPCKACSLKETSDRLIQRNIKVANSVRQQKAEVLVGTTHNRRVITRLLYFRQIGRYLSPYYLVKCLLCGHESEVCRASAISCGCAYCARYKGSEPRSREKRITNRGYVQVRLPGHPMSEKNGWCFEHRLVMANHLGRNLMPYEDVHHIKSWEKDNNDISNLELWCRKHPAGSRVEDVVAFAKEILALYEPGALAHI